MKKIKKLRKSQPTFWHYVKKIEAQAKKKWFSYQRKKRVFGNGSNLLSRAQSRRDNYRSLSFDDTRQ